MKKTFLLIAALLLTASAAMAQTTSRWGITAGANFNEVHFKQTDIVPSKRAWGPQFSFLVGGNNRNINAYSPVSVYLDMGAGIEIKERLQLRAGYNFSIGQTFHTKLLDDNVAKNRTWYFNVTWFLK